MLRTSDLTYTGDSEHLPDGLLSIGDGFENSQTDRCFDFVPANSDNSSQVELYFKLPKFISHVQILVPNYDHGNILSNRYFSIFVKSICLVTEMSELTVEYCNIDQKCVFCERVDTASKAEWVSVECDAKNTSEFVRISGNIEKTASRFPTYICDVEIFGSEFRSLIWFAAKAYKGFCYRRH